MKVKIKCDDLIDLFNKLSQDDSNDQFIKQHYFDLASELYYGIPQDVFEINAELIKNPKCSYFPKRG